MSCCRNLPTHQSDYIIGQAEIPSCQPLTIGGAMHVNEVEAEVIHPTTSADIERLQLAMIPLRCEMPEAIHHFTPGIYCREFTLPAGHTVVGKRHKHEHFLFVLRGKALVWSEFGEDVLEAGFISISQPGVKRVVMAIEDTTFVTVHANRGDSRDLEEIEAEHILPETDEYKAAEAEMLRRMETMGELA